MDNRNEKKIIIYLIIAALILIYISFFFIHDIVDRGRIQDTASGTITSPDNGVLDENIDKDNKPGKDHGQKPDDSDKDEDQDDGYIVDNSDRFKVLQGQTEFKDLKELDIFKNSYFKDESIIAPGVQGSYNFTVENESDTNFIYNVTFTEENPYQINMVFKVKVNGEYVLGNEKNWVKHGDLSRSNLLLNAKSNDLYTIEWKWQDNYNDTQIGETDGAYYKMYINVDAEQIVEE